MKKIVFTENAPEAVGPYSQAVKYKDMVFLSGQVSINPDTGEVENGTVEEQTRRVLLNIKEVLKAAGSGFDQILKCNVYLSDIDAFEEMNQVYSEFFPDNHPARLCVSKVDIYGGLAVEIDVIAGTD